MPYRQLAAIMFTDIVGYTSLMGSDEQKALDLLKKSRRIHRRLIRKYSGKWLKEMGDGILASFSSNMDAVICAISIIKATSELDIPIRVGIHQGDVIFEQKDVLGDGVNVASRIDRFAESSGLVVSETVYNEIRNKDGLEIESLGTHHLKGVNVPVGIFKVTCTDFDLLGFKIDTGELTRPLGSKGNLITIGIILFALIFYVLQTYVLRDDGYTKKFDNSVLVLPIDNYTGTDTLDYFMAGMHSAIIGDIGKVSALRVLSKTTANAVRKEEKSIPEIASELGVNYVLELSVLCFGKDSFCIQPKLLSVYPEEAQVWTGEYLEDKSHILNFYNRLTKEISKEIDVRLTPQEERLLSDTKLVNPEAYAAYLKGMSYWELGKKEDMEKSMIYFERAREIDPDFALAYLGIARAWGGYMQHGFMNYDSAMNKKEIMMKKAMDLDSTSYEIRAGMGNHYAWGVWDWKKAEREFRIAIEINPNYPFAHAYYSHLLAVTGNIEKSLEQSEIAISLEPLNTLHQSVHIMNLKNARRYDEALEVALELYNDEPDQGIGLPAIWAVYHELEQYDDALEIARRIYRNKRNYKALEALDAGYNEGGYHMAMQRTAEKMIELSDSTYIPSWQVCTLYCRAEIKEQALDWLEKAFNEHDPNMPYISVDPLFDFLRKEERFKAILGKMNLPPD